MFNFSRALNLNSVQTRLSLSFLEIQMHTTLCHAINLKYRSNQYKPMNNYYIDDHVNFPQVFKELAELVENMRIFNAPCPTVQGKGKGKIKAKLTPIKEASFQFHEQWCNFPCFYVPFYFLNECNEIAVTLVKSCYVA